MQANLDWNGTCRSAKCAALVLCLVLPWLGGCGALSVVHTNQLIGAGATVTGSLSPSSDIEQTYYLGSFDPRSQLPPAIYRIRVRGQSSFLNQTRFASSWVPAEVVDSLTGSLSIDNRNGKVSAERDAATTSSLEGAGRGLVMFGPEGFREAPRGHRLVVIMGADPELVEQAFSSALGSVAQVKFGRSGAALNSGLFATILKLDQEREQLTAVAAEH